MLFYLPDWDDRVDREYDFEHDRHSIKHNRDPYLYDAYIWEIYDEVPLDGVLVSRVIVENNKRKKSAIMIRGIRKYLRLPSKYPILGDCGAWGYMNQDKPPYDPKETIDYYVKAGFNEGVTVDHLIVPQYAEKKEERMKITFKNGIEGFNYWKEKYKEVLDLLVAVQGWSIEDYLTMFKDYYNHGIRMFAFGGLARSTTAFIEKLLLKLIELIKGLSDRPSRIHFFGIARPKLFPLFRDLEELGVTVSFDSAGFLRRAWLSSKANYCTLSGKTYTAIRIPFANTPLLRRYELKALETLRKYDRGEASLDETIKALEEYERTRKSGKNFLKYYLVTLRDKPWKKCPCKICREIGVEIIIFRGNNRNRRRGFHNVWVFYNLFKLGKWSLIVGENQEQHMVKQTQLMEYIS